LLKTGLALTLLGILLTFVAVLWTAVKYASGKGKAEWGGVLLIGPIPIAFGSSPKMAIVAMALALALMVLALLLTWYSWRPG